MFGSTVIVFSFNMNFSRLDSRTSLETHCFEIMYVPFGYHTVGIITVLYRYLLLETYDGSVNKVKS